MFDNIKKTINSFLPSRRKEKNQDVIESQPVTLTPVTRQKLLNETARRTYSTELLDTYYGFGRPYIQALIKATVTNRNIQNQMILVTRCLPLLKFFTHSVSRVYATQPERRFYFEGKEIIKTPKEDSSGESDQTFNKFKNEEKFYYNDELYEILNNLYNDDIILGIKQSERLTNLLNTVVYKIVTNEKGEVRMTFLPNDSVQIKTDKSNVRNAEQIAFIQDVIQEGSGMLNLTTVLENWSKDKKVIPLNSEIPEDGEVDEENKAAKEYENLFGTKECGSGFAPFVIFRDNYQNVDFWDIKDNDVVEYIKSINMSITELRYLEKFTSFGLKYTVNIKLPEDGVMDPNGIWQLAVENNSVPGSETGKNWDIGEFDNKGRIDEVIRAIIFNVKMLFSMYNIPLDALISTNSKSSAESKQEDTKELFAEINSRRDIWNLNEQNLFKVLQAVHNRDNDNKIPKGVEMIVDFDEKASVEKVAEDWIVEIQNDVSTIFDWISDKNPDLDRDEVMELFKSNKAINDKQKEESIDLNMFENNQENNPNNQGENSNNENNQENDNNDPNAS